MVNSNTVFICLSVLLIVQQVYWSYQVQKLVDKLMSRNYHEYEQAKSQFMQPIAPNIMIPQDPEDIAGAFGGISPL